LINIAGEGWLGKPPDPDDPSDDLYLRFNLIMQRLRAAGLRDKVLHLSLELEELLKWLVPTGTPRQRQAVLMSAFEASDPKAKTELFRSVVSHLRGLRRGRPVTPKRRLWVEALEKKLRGKNGLKELSWMEITIKLCDCDKPAHTQQCKNRIRQGVRKLQRMLQKYQISPSLMAKRPDPTSESWDFATP
jgi:hypothetical protein